MKAAPNIGDEVQTLNNTQKMTVTALIWEQDTGPTHVECGWWSLDQHAMAARFPLAVIKPADQDTDKTP